MEPNPSLANLLRYIFSSSDAFMRWARGVVILALLNAIVLGAISESLAERPRPSASTLWWSGLFQNISTEMLGISVSALVFSLLWRVIELNPRLLKR